ncbi:hypothetical protein N2152v2_003670 [Parachlorella kessleri]
MPNHLEWFKVPLLQPRNLTRGEVARIKDAVMNIIGHSIANLRAYFGDTAKHAYNNGNRGYAWACLDFVKVLTIALHLNDPEVDIRVLEAVLPLAFEGIPRLHSDFDSLEPEVLYLG